MDLFFSVVSKAGVVPRARRLHFNDAMDELHRRMHRLELERAMLNAKQNEAFLQSVAAHEHKRMVRDFVYLLCDSLLMLYHEHQNWRTSTGCTLDASYSFSTSADRPSRNKTEIYPAGQARNPPSAQPVTEAPKLPG